MSETDFELPQGSVQPYTRSRPLPPYQGIVAVDAKDFTGSPAIEHGAISQAIPKILQVAFGHAELSDIWERRQFPASTGDGYVFGFDPSAMPYVIHPWLTTLQNVLTEFNLNSMGVARLRLRVSLHIGPLPNAESEGDPEGEAGGEPAGGDGAAFATLRQGNGTPRNDTHRLLDSRPVKAMLASSSENITQLAAILSDRCYQDAVVSGYTGRHPDHFIEVPATVEDKQFEQRAWLHIPAPSGNLYDRRILGDRVVEDAESGRRKSREPADGRTGSGGTESDDASQHTVYRADHGNLNLGRVSGGQHVRNVDVEGDYINGDSVTGNKVGTVHGNLGDTVHGDKHGDIHQGASDERNGRRKSPGGGR